jgi:hypothetical protein
MLEQFHFQNQPASAKAKIRAIDLDHRGAANVWLDLVVRARNALLG